LWELVLGGTEEPQRVNNGPIEGAVGRDREEEVHTLDLNRHLYTHIHSTIILDSQKVETTQGLQFEYVYLTKFRCWRLITSLMVLRGEIF
jgi:hypothetical protein